MYCLAPETHSAKSCDVKKTLNVFELETLLSLIWTDRTDSILGLGLLHDEDQKLLSLTFFQWYPLFGAVDKNIFWRNISIFTRYHSNQTTIISLISLRLIYYCDTWSIIWHDIVCWFIFFPLFLPVLVWCDHKIVQTSKQKQFSDRVAQIIVNSWQACVKV